MSKFTMCSSSNVHLSLPSELLGLAPLCRECTGGFAAPSRRLMICATFSCTRPATARDLNLKGRDNGSAAAGCRVSPVCAEDGVNRGTYREKRDLLPQKAHVEAEAAWPSLQSRRASRLCAKNTVATATIPNGRCAAMLFGLLPNVEGATKHQFQLDAKFGDRK